MNELQAAGAVAVSLKPIIDLAKAMVDAAGSAKLKQQAVELYGEILATQTRALAANAAQTALIQEKAGLEKQIVKLEGDIRKHDDWNEQKARYALTAICSKYESFAVMLKPTSDLSEANPRLCPHCFEEHKKRVLTSGGNMFGVETITCSDCGYNAKVKREWDAEPMQPRPNGGYF